MAYTQVIERKKATRYRGFYRDADGRYKSAGTYGTEDRALEVAREAEEHAAALISGAVGGLDPATRATRTIEEYEPVFLRHHRVEGKTKDTYSGTLRLHVIPFLGKVRLAEMNRTAARNYFTALEEAGRSPNSIRQAKVVLAALFTWAVSDGYLDVNPFPGHRPGSALTEDALAQRLHAIGISPRQGRSTALLALAAEVPAAILAKTLGIHVQVAVHWQKISASDWTAYAADVSRRRGSQPVPPRHETQGRP